MNNSDHSNFNSGNNIIFKNEALKNMMNKITEDAKKQFASSARNTSEHKKLMNLNLDDYFSEENHKPIHTSIQNCHENFSNEYFLERYKQFIPSTLITPTEFNITKGMEKIKTSKIFNENVSNYTVDPEEAIKKRYHMEMSYKLNLNLSLINWIDALKFLTKTSVADLSERLIKNNFQLFEYLQKSFSEFCLSSNGKDLIVCEVAEINIIDCLQIVTVKDFNLTTTKFVVMKDDQNSLIDDSYFTIGEVLLIKLKSLKNMTNFLADDNLSLVNIRDIKQINKE
jgi:hypothetical protein